MSNFHTKKDKKKQKKKKKLNKSSFKITWMDIGTASRPKKGLTFSVWKGLEYTKKNMHKVGNPDQSQLPLFEDSKENSTDKITFREIFDFKTFRGKILPFYFYRKGSNKIEKPPASFLLQVADSLPKKNRQNLEQEISDLRLEYYETLKEKKIWRARCIVAVYYIGVGWSAVMWISDKAKEVVGIIPKKD